MKFEERRRLAIEFVKLYREMDMHLQKCPICYCPAEIEYSPGSFAKLYCPNGCGIVTIDNTAKAQKMSNHEMVRKCLERWNHCSYDM